MSNTAEIARAMATTMENAAIPMYGKKLRLPDRSAIIALLKVNASACRTGRPSSRF